MKKTLITLFLFIVVILCGIFIIFNKRNENEYTDNLFYMDTYIYIKIYSADEEKARDALKEVDSLYKKYHQLSDRYNHYDDMMNVYDLLHTSSKEEYLEIDIELYNMISYGLEWLEKSNGLLDIRMGNIIDVWKAYRDTESGIPSIEELEIAEANMVKEIVLKDGTFILNNHPNLDLGAIAKGYATQEVGEYLESIGITKYIINAGGNVKVGNHYNHSSYSIGIEDPNSSTGDIYKVVYGNNISVVTSGGYARYYEYNGKKYHHIIDPNTLLPPEYSKSVTVITNDSALGDVLSTILFLLPIDEGKKFIDGIDNVEAVWYTNDNEVVQTKGMKTYEIQKK